MITPELLRIRSAHPLMPNTVVVSWKDGSESRADLTGWIATGAPLLDPLLNPLFFSTVRMAEYGSALAWGWLDTDEDIMLDAHHLKMLADEQLPFTGANLGAWQRAENLSNQEAADLLGLSLSGYNAYKTSTGSLPTYIAMLCRAMARDNIVKQAHLKPRQNGRPPLDVYLMFHWSEDARRILIVHANTAHGKPMDLEKWVPIGSTDRLPPMIARQVKQSGKAEFNTRFDTGKEAEFIAAG